MLYIHYNNCRTFLESENCSFFSLYFSTWLQKRSYDATVIYLDAVIGSKNYHFYKFIMQPNEVSWFGVEFDIKKHFHCFSFRLESCIALWSDGIKWNAYLTNVSWLLHLTSVPRAMGSKNKIYMAQHSAILQLFQSCEVATCTQLVVYVWFLEKLQVKESLYLEALKIVF